MDLTTLDKIAGGGRLAGKKTYATALLAVLAGIYFYLSGEASVEEAAGFVIGGGGLAFARSAVGKIENLLAQLRDGGMLGALAPICLVLPLLGACQWVPSDTVGDMLLAEADTTEERITRMVCVGSIVAELAHERVTSREPLDAGVTSAALVRMAAPLRKAGEDGGTHWTETELLYVKREILRMAREYGTPRIAAFAATGPTVDGVLASVGRAALLNAMRIDVARLLEPPTTTGPPAPDARATCWARFDKRLGEIKSIAGEG